MKSLVIFLLTFCAKRFLRRFHPRVIGVTGSYGKTSVRLAIVTLLRTAKWSVSTPAENYNNEIGFPLGILGLKSPGSSAVGWLQGLFRAAGLAFFGARKDVPSTLVLEYGADHKGDIAKLCRIVSPDIAVLTGVSPAHAEGIGTLEEIVAEKSTLAKMVRQGGTVVINGDDAHAEALGRGVSVPVVRYGFDEGVQVRVRSFSHEQPISPELSRMHLHIEALCGTYDADLSNVLGKPVASAAAAAVAVAEILRISPDVVSEGLSTLRAVPGRLQLLEGVKGTVVIDDTYNAAPAAMAAAVEALRTFPVAEQARRIAVLGHMAELGQYTESEHKKLGGFVAASNVDLLLCVGECARDLGRGAKEAGMSADRVMEFATTKEAGIWLDRNIHAGDVVLVKGSQSARMEKIVKEIMAEPMRAPELLVRQYGGWLA